MVDEVVVVDTGSSDGTQDIAGAAGAKVVEAEWPGDLARAHDLPVAHATGDWILALDADEVLDPRRRHLVREAVASTRYEGYALPVRNYVYGWPVDKWRGADPTDALTRGAAGYVHTAPIRLFRRRPAYRYSGLVHQSVNPAIEDAGGRVGALDVPIHHYGFLRFDRDKSDFYRRLAQRHADENPDAAQAWTELGVVLVGSDRLPAAADAFRRARALGDPAGSFFLGTTLLDLGHPAASARFLDEAISGHADGGSPFYDAADAWEALGFAYDEEGRRDEAEDAYRSALRLRPDSPAASANLAALLLRERRLPEAEPLLDDLLQRFPGSAVAWSLVGTLRLRAGELEAARKALTIALECRPGNVAALVNLARTHARAGRRRAAAAVHAAAAERLGSAEARSVDLERRLPGRYRRPRRRRLARVPGRVVSVIPTLAGGAGRVAVDAVLALPDRPQLVLCAESQSLGRQGLRRELEANGVAVVIVPSEAALRLVLARARPAVVLHHWWRNEIFPGLTRTADERWICIGHMPQPMPRGYDAYVVNSRFNDRFQSHLPGDRVFRFTSAVDVGRFAARERLARRTPVTIAMLSRLEPGKFPRRLLQHLPPLDRARVLIGGAGPRRHEIEPEIEHRGLQGRVRFVGMVPSARVPSFLGAADIGLHLTETHEELCSLTVLEMLAAGLPVVAEPKGELPELVLSGENGFLATGEQEVAERVAELVASPELRARMGAASRERAGGFDMARFRSAVRELVASVEQGPPVPLFPRSRRRPGIAVRHGRTPSLTYLVCGTPRSGSSLLCEALAGTGLAGNPSEYFEPPLMRTLAGSLGTGTVDDYLAELFDRMTTPNGVFGAKLLTDEPRELFAALRRTPGRTRLAAPALLAAVLPNLRLVRLTRRDRVRQAVSLERAAQEQVFFDVSEPAPISLPRSRFDRRAVERRLEDIDEGEARWDAFFAEAGVAPVEVVYEDLTADYEGTALRVLEELGIDVPDEVWFAPRRLRRQADAVTERWVERFRASSSSRRQAHAAGMPAHAAAGAATRSSTRA